MIPSTTALQVGTARWTFEPKTSGLSCDNGEWTSLTPKECIILAELLANHGRIVEDRALLKAGWGNVAIEPQCVTKTVHGLRNKIKDVHKKVIRKVRGRGYVLTGVSGDLSTLAPSSCSNQLGLKSGEMVGHAFHVMPHLEKLIVSAHKPVWLMVSAIYGDVTDPFLWSLFERYEARRGREPQLEGVLFKYPSLNLARTMIKAGQRKQSFWRKLQYHLSEIDECLERFNIPFDPCEWTSIPPFHGYLCGDHAFSGPWEKTEQGLYYTRTPLTYYSKAAHPQEWSEIMHGFVGNGDATERTR